MWDQATAERYDQDAAEKFAPVVLDPTVELLARLAGSCAAYDLTSQGSTSHHYWREADGTMGRKTFTSDSESHISVWRKP